MSWNYRVVKKGETWLRIHEVYYDDDGNIELWSRVTHPEGETITDLMEDLDHMRDALYEPILNIEYMPK